MKKEVDRILDKINSKGFGSLSDDEKKILDEAGDLLKKGSSRERLFRWLC